MHKGVELNTTQQVIFYNQLFQGHIITQIKIWIKMRTNYTIELQFIFQRPRRGFTVTHWLPLNFHIIKLHVYDFLHNFPTHK